MAFQNNDNELRRIEREVLDPFHKTFPIHNHNHNDARLGILAAFDCIAFPSMMLRHKSEFEIRYAERRIEEGISQALRWVTPPEDEPSVSSIYKPGLINDAGEYLFHA